MTACSGLWYMLRLLGLYEEESVPTFASRRSSKSTSVTRVTTSCDPDLVDTCLGLWTLEHVRLLGVRPSSSHTGLLLQLQGLALPAAAAACLLNLLASTCGESEPFPLTACMCLSVGLNAALLTAS